MNFIRVDLQELTSNLWRTEYVADGKNILFNYKRCIFLDRIIKETVKNPITVFLRLMKTKR